MSARQRAPFKIDVDESKPLYLRVADKYTEPKKLPYSVADLYTGSSSCIRPSSCITARYVEANTEKLGRQQITQRLLLSIQNGEDTKCSTDGIQAITCWVGSQFNKLPSVPSCICWSIATLEVHGTPNTRQTAIETPTKTRFSITDYRSQGPLSRVWKAVKLNLYE